MKVFEAYVNAEDERVLADSPELAREKIAEIVDDYFGNPIQWKEPSIMSKRFFQTGTFYSHAHTTETIIVCEREVYTR